MLRNVPASGLADSAVVPVRQCRLHYLFASHHVILLHCINTPYIVFLGCYAVIR